MMFKSFSFIKSTILYSAKVKQFFQLSSATLLAIPLGIISNILLTRYLGVEDYGNYTLILNIFTFSVLIFNVGFFQACNRALVLNHNKKRTKEYFGTSLIILFSLFIIMSLFLLLYGLYDSNLKQKSIEKVFIYSIPIGAIFLLQNYFECLFQADNKIKLLSQTRLFPKLFFTISISVLFFLFDEYPVKKIYNCLLIFFCTQIIAYFYTIIKIKISFKNIKKRFNEIWIFNKTFGLNVYLGSVLAVGLSTLSGILISYFGYNNSGVGFYSLALSFSMPLAFIPNTIATTYYKDFVNAKTIPLKLFLITIVLSFIALITLWVIVPPFINFFYGESYLTVIQINYIVSVAVVLYGLGDFFNRYLGANGQGIALRNSAFIVAAILLIFNLLLIPKFGEYGASYAKLIAGFFYLVSIFYHYQKFKNKINLRIVSHER